MGSFYRELKRRKVFRVAAVYVVVAWVLIQVADVVLPTFGAPGWVNQTIIFVFILGFPLALILSWAYEVTPEGIRFDSQTPTQVVTTSSGDRKLIYAIFVLVLLVAGFQIADRFFLVPSELVSNTGQSMDSPGDQSTVRSSIYLGHAPEVFLGNRPTLAISPDGRRIAYVQINEDGQHLYLRELDQLQSRILTTLSGSSTSARPFFSPDSQQIAYLDGNRLTRISVRGDTPQTLATGLTESVIAWESDQSILYTDGDEQLLYRVPAVGGAPERLQLEIDDGEEQMIPHVLPGGEALLYNHSSGRLVWRGIRLANLETGEVRTLIQRGYSGRYVNSGHIVFMRATTLWAVPFDLERLEITGAEVPVVQGIQAAANLGIAQYSVSDNGRLIYHPGTEMFAGGALRNLVWVDREGQEELVDVGSNKYLHPQISPNGEFISITIPDDNGNTDIWVYELRRGVSSRRTFTGAAESAIWTPDSGKLVYGTTENAWGAWITAADGTGQPEPLIRENEFLRVETFTPDGGQFVYRKGEGTANLFSSSIDGDGTGQLLVSEDTAQTSASISPDGRWIAYQSFESGQWEIYVRPYPNVNDGKWQISTTGGTEPRWGPEGAELYYRRGSAPAVEILAVPIDTNSGFSPGVPSILFTGDFISSGSFRANFMNYDVSADGQRFLMSKAIRNQVENPEPEEIHFILVDNWFTELERLAPTKVE